MTQTQTRSSSGRRSTSAVGLVLTGVVVVGLLVDAAVHAHLAPEYELAFPGGIGGGTLFYIQAVVAFVTAVGVLVWRRRPMYAVAFLVALSAFAAVVISRYVELPAVGQVPAMYEPLWFLEKSVSAVAEGLAALAALALFVLSGKRSSTGERAPAPRQSRDKGDIRS